MKKFLDSAFTAALYFMSIITLMLLGVLLLIEEIVGWVRVRVGKLLNGMMR